MLCVFDSRGDFLARNCDPTRSVVESVCESVLVC